MALIILLILIYTMSAGFIRIAYQEVERKITGRQWTTYLAAFIVFLIFPLIAAYTLGGLLASFVYDESDELDESLDELTKFLNTKKEENENSNNGSQTKQAGE